eukprot:Em0002g1888a
MDRRALAYPTAEDWSKAWKDWARGRKRGKMAQFIIEKLEEGKQARWLDISLGKFELCEWHAIADIWYRAKQNRNSDESDAPCMLRKGLPRAFPGLEELKAESMKEGTQYRSRVFQSSGQLIREVAHHLPSRPGGVKCTPYPLSNGQSSYVAPGNGLNQFASSNGQNQFASSNGQQQQYMEVSRANSGGVAVGSAGYLNGYSRVPSGSTSGSTSPNYTIDDSSLLGDSNEWLEDLAVCSHGASPSLYQAQESSPYSVSTNSSSYSVPFTAGRTSPYAPSPYAPSSYAPSPNSLLVPADQSETAGVDWTSQLPISPGHSYSPEPSAMTAPALLPVSVPVFNSDMTQGIAPAMSEGFAPTISPAVSQGFQGFHLDLSRDVPQLQAIPSKSPTEGGGQLALLLNREMPAGKKVIVFMSTTKPEYTTSIDCHEVNPMALIALIPKHAIPEPVVLQVVCDTQVIGSTEFLYYADAAYSSEMFYQFLCQNLPRYYHQSDVFGGTGAPHGGAASMGPTYGSGYCNNVPTSMYGILIGSCRMGLESLVHATLTLPAMRDISLEQLEKAREAALEQGHHSLGTMLGGLLESRQIVPRGGEASNGVYCSRIASLHRGEGTPEEEASKVIKSLTDAIKANQVNVKVEGGDQEVPKTPATPSQLSQASLVSEVVEGESDGVKVEDNGCGSMPVVASQEATKSQSPHKLPRQDKSIRESEASEELADHVPPMHAEVTTPHDEGPPGRRGNMSRQGKSRITGGQNKTLVATPSETDSAVSMSFDDDTGSDVGHVQGSTSLSGPVLEAEKFPGTVSVTFNPQLPVALMETLHYEHGYVIAEDFPPEERKLKCGDRIIAIGDKEVNTLSNDEFDRLLRAESAKGSTTFRVSSQNHIQMDRTRALSPPSHLPLGHLPGDEEFKYTSQKQGENTIATKVANFLAMKPSSRAKRVVVIPRSPEGFGFKVLGGNAVGLFVSETHRKDLEPGDQILEINGHMTQGLAHYEATHLLRQTTDQLTMTLVDNYSRYTSLKDQVECDSFYLKSTISYTPEDPKEMKLQPGSLLHVVNTFLYREHWLAWAVDQNGLESGLRKIHIPARTTPMSSEYERVELRSVPHLRPLVLLGANDRVISKELNTLDDFTECTRIRDVDRLCIPGGSQHAVITMSQPSDLTAIKHFSPLVIHAILRPPTHQEALVKKTFHDLINITVEADSVAALTAAVKEKVKVLQQQPVWVPVK